MKAVEPVLRMILGGQGIVQRIPNGVGLIKIETGQDHRPLGQFRNRLHEQGRCPARPGRARDKDRMLRRRFGPEGRQTFGGQAALTLGIQQGFGEIGCDQVDEPPRPVPMRGQV